MLLWIDFLFALWHLRWHILNTASGCGLISYSLFDIKLPCTDYCSPVVDWFLIRSLTFENHVLRRIWQLWIDFLFALWHCGLNEATRIPSCGLISYSLFDIFAQERLTFDSVVDWFLIRSLTFFALLGRPQGKLWIDFLFALWHSQEIANKRATVVDWFLIRSLTFLVFSCRHAHLLWIDFLFALWHFRADYRFWAAGCGLISYSLFDIYSSIIWSSGLVVDWFLIRSLTLGLHICTPIWTLWIDFLFALWHFPACYMEGWKCCGLISYSLFDIR